MDRDPSLDALLELDGQVLVIDSDIRRWVRSAVRRVPASEAKPHGLDYSLTLHGPDGERWRVSTTRIRLGAGRGPGGKTGSTFDHKHRLKTVRPYEYKRRGDSARRLLVSS
jgi:hypothetical protein